MGVIRVRASGRKNPWPCRCAAAGGGAFVTGRLTRFHFGWEIDCLAMLRARLVWR